jgi:hypothetical protein
LIYSVAQRNLAENDTKDTDTQMKSLLSRKNNEARETKAKLSRARARASTATTEFIIQRFSEYAQFSQPISHPIKMPRHQSSGAQIARAF